MFYNIILFDTYDHGKKEHGHLRLFNNSIRI